MLKYYFVVPNITDIVMEHKIIKECSRMEMEGKDNKHNRENIQSITPTRAFDARCLLAYLSIYFGINIDLMTPRNFVGSTTEFYTSLVSDINGIFFRFLLISNLKNNNFNYGFKWLP